MNLQPLKTSFSEIERQRRSPDIAAKRIAVLADAQEPVSSYQDAFCASGATSVGGRKNTVSTIERRLSALVWAYTQRGIVLDRHNRHLATVLAGVRNTDAAPPRQKEAILSDDLLTMLETCDRGPLRGLRDRAMLLMEFAGSLRRSEIIGLDPGRDQTEDGRGCIEVLPGGLLVPLRGKTGWREVEINRGSSPATCPVEALELWLKFGVSARDRCSVV
ncbi:hypothetical protein [Paracoccus sp. IB05]|uniref:hypothetical protein n=1 Tax=Paracoccus sp. IB05 TaxID=2779367 RepID=UPI0018E7783B|nr:hypothetical protein [Paracoccus sp. IB05]